MGLFEVIVPEATTNYVKNPSFEENQSDNWTLSLAGVNGTAAQSVTGYYGVYGLNLTAGDDTVWYTSNTIGVDNNESLTVQCYIYSTAGNIQGDLIIRDTTNNNNRGSDSQTSTGSWEYLTQTWTNTSGGHVAAAVRLANDTNNNVTEIFFDGIQAELKGYDTTYCDGDQEACAWNGEPHNSTSQRSALSAAGGRIRDLADDFDFHVTNVEGVGVPPHIINRQPYSLLPGASFQSTKVVPAVIQLSGVVKGGTLATMHDNRKSLIDAFALDGVQGTQPVKIRYTGGTTTKEIKVFYEGGLEYSGQINPDDPNAIVRLLALDPFWYGVNDSSAVIDETNTLYTETIAGRIGGAWDAMGTPASGGNIVYAISISSGKGVYIGGSFTNWDGIANADYVASWDGTDWAALGTGASGGVNTIVIAPNDDVYIGGQFAGAGGVANTVDIAKWNGSAWSALGTGADDNFVDDLDIAPDGNLYACGHFTGMGGVANTKGIASWNGSAWSALGTGLLNGAAGGQGDSIAVDNNNNVYVGGTFNTAGSTAASNIAMYSNGTWYALGDGLDAQVDAVAIAPDGTLYAGGAFDDIEGNTATYLNHIAKWNGTEWEPLGDGLAYSGGAAYVNGNGIDIAPDGTVYVTGRFDSAGDVSTPGGIARWNGFTWSALDLEQPGTPEVYAVRAGPPDPVINNVFDLYIGLGATGSSTVAGTTTATNGGAIPTRPIIELTSSSNSSNTFYGLRNETNGLEMFGNYNVQNGETLTIDTRHPNPKITSDFFGARPDALRENSNLTDFVLEPGGNTVSAFAESSITITMRWKTTYKGFDD